MVSKTRSAVAAAKIATAGATMMKLVAEADHRAKATLGDLVDGAGGKASREEAVKGGRRAAALDVAEDGEAHFVAGIGAFDLGEKLGRGGRDSFRCHQHEEGDAARA